MERTMPFKIFDMSPADEFLVNETLVLCSFKAYPIYTPVTVDKATGEVITELCEVIVIDKAMDCEAVHDLLKVIAAVRLQEPWPLGRGIY